MGYAKIVLNGRITKDLEVKATNNGKKVLNFGVAVAINKDTTEFYNCCAFEKNAEFIAQYYGKGDGIIVEGSPRFREWNKDGATHKDLEVLISNCYFADAKKVDKKDVFEEVQGGADLPF